MTDSNSQPTRFYKYSPAANFFAGVGLDEVSDDGDTVVALQRKDNPLLSTWKRRTCHGFEDNPSVIGDFPTVFNYSSIPMMSERAWNTLSPIIGVDCEALPVQHPFSGIYYIIHVMATIDALDVKNSIVHRSQIGDKRIRRIYQYSFREHLIKGHHIFKLPLSCGAGLFVDDLFRSAVEANHLVGLDFRELPMAPRVPYK